MALGALFVLPFLPWALRAGGRRVGWRPLAVGAAAGVALCLSVRSELEGLARLPAGTLTVLLGTLPIWVTAVAWVGFGRVPTSLERLAIATVVVGVAVMALPVGAATDPIGVAFGILSALCFTSFLAVIERNRAVPTAASFLLGLVSAGVLLLVVTPGTAAGLADGEPSAAIILAIGATTALWAVLVGFGLQATDSVTAAIVVGVEPVLVAVLAFVLLGENLSARELVGGLILLGALAATTLQVARDASASASEGPAAASGGIPEAPGPVQSEPDRAG
jgi:drug/metabolite transporter (DMT)-like permease